MYLAIARETLRKGEWPLQDPFLYSLPQNTWTILHQWLSYFVFYGLYQLGGFDLIVVAKVLLLITCVLMPWFWARRSANMAGVWGLSLILALYASLFRFMERSSLFSDLLMILLLNLLLAEKNKSGKAKFFLPVMFLAWVNLHPGFPLGWGLIGLFLLCQLWLNPGWQKEKSFRQWLLVLFLSVAVCLCNPRGLEGVLYPFNFVQEMGPVYHKYYYEWYATLDPLFLMRPQTLFLALLVALNWLLLWQARKSKPWFEALVSFALLAYGLSAIRFVPSLCFALLSVNSFLAASLSAEFFARLRPWLAALALVLAGKNIFFGYDTIAGPRTVGFGFDLRVVPQKAVEFLQAQNLQGHIFNAHIFGSYLAWAMDGPGKVFYHGFTTDPDFFLKDYTGFSRSPEEFQILVDKYQIQAFLVDRFQGEESLLKNIVNSHHWGLAYQDEGSLVFLPIH